MTKREQYQLRFYKVYSDNRIEYMCDHTGQNAKYNRLALKLSLMHKIECEALIETILDAENGEYYETDFVLNADTASDEDGIEISYPNVIIDNQLSISFIDMKILLQEWIDYKENN